MVNICVTKHKSIYFSDIFSDIEQCCRSSSKNSSENQNPATLKLTRTIYHILVNIPGLYISRCRQKGGHRPRQIEFQNYLQTDIFLISLKHIYIWTIMVYKDFFKTTKVYYKRKRKKIITIKNYFTWIAI